MPHRRKPDHDGRLTHRAATRSVDPTRSLVVFPPSPALATAMAAVAALAIALFAISAALTSPPAGAQHDDAPATDEPATDEPAAEEEAEAAETARLQQGAEVYSQICSSCHQPGGAGLPGQFPPLVDNPNVDDAAYVAEVINNGRQGEIVVNGETYDGVMPSFSTLGEDEIAAVIAFIQNDFVAPASEQAGVASSGPVAGTELPALTNMGHFVAYALAAVVAAMVLAPRFTSANSRLEVPWLDAWLKTAAIVLAVIFFTVYVPDWALKTSTVSKLDRFAQDVIGVALWGGGLAAVLWGLWYAHRESRI